MHATLAAAERDDAAAVRRWQSRLPAEHPVSELVALEVRFLSGGEVAADALDFARSHPDYVAAWAFGVNAARRESRWLEALEAARKLRDLQPTPRREREVESLEGHVVAHGAEEAEALLMRGEPAAAVERARAVLEAVPGAEPPRMIMVRAFLAMGDAREAAGLVPALPDTADGLRLKGAVAEALGQWNLAAQLYARIPKGTPGRCALLVEARNRARRATAPPYVSRALESPSLTRGQLAAILVWEAPAVAQHATGQIVVFEDVVQTPERRDIVTAVRAGLMQGDAVTRRFRPERKVSGTELIGVVERLAGLLGKPRPRWCREGDSEGDCIQAPAEVVTGESVVRLIRHVSLEGEEGCPQA